MRLSTIARTIQISRRYVVWVAGLVVLLFLVVQGISSINPILHRSTYTPFQLTESSLSPLQLVSIGSTFDQTKLAQQPSVSHTTDKATNQETYQYTSSITTRPNQILTQNNRVTYERLVLPLDPNNVAFAKLSTFKQKFGDSDETSLGSKFYGNYITVAIYASKGFTLIANRNTDTVFEIQLYSPRSVDDYKQHYGSDLVNHTGNEQTQTGVPK